MPPYEDRHSLPVEASASDGESIFPLARAPAAQPVGMVPVLTGFEGPFRLDPDAEPRTSTFFFEPDELSDADIDAQDHEEPVTAENVA